jgi:hypothetical protein
VLRDKLEIARDPQAYKQKLLAGFGKKRPTMMSPSAVLRPVPGKKR